METLKSAKTLSDVETVFRQLWPSLFPKPTRKPRFDFPDAIIHASETAVKKRQLYADAKAGDAEAKSDIVSDTVNPEKIESLKSLLKGRKPLPISAHFMEGDGVNAIPEALAGLPGEKPGLEIESGM